jgi:flagellar hook assembly protein FlgD
MNRQFIKITLFSVCLFVSLFVMSSNTYACDVPPELYYAPDESLFYDGDNLYINAGGSIDFTAYGYDPDGGDVTYTWKKYTCNGIAFPTNSQENGPSGTSATEWNPTFYEYGLFAIKIEVTDNENNTVYHTWYVYAFDTTIETNTNYIPCNQGYSFPYSVRPSSLISVYDWEPDWVRFIILDNEWSSVKYSDNNLSTSVGDDIYTWNGKDNNDNGLTPGYYNFVVEADKWKYYYNEYVYYYSYIGQYLFNGTLSPQYSNIAYGTGMNFTYSINPSSGWTASNVFLDINDTSNNKICSYSLSTSVGSNLTYTWDGKGTEGSYNGSYLPAGTYNAYLKVKKGNLYYLTPASQFTIYKVTAIQWVKYDDNLDLESWTNERPETGKKIFPDKKSFNDSEPAKRKKVYIEATITPPLIGVPVFFSAWDIDDPSANGTPIDTYNISPFQTGPDNYGTGAQLEDGFTYGGTYYAVALTDFLGHGKASAVFDVSMQPGDNFKIAASTDALGVIKYDSQTCPGGKMTQEIADKILPYYPLPEGVVLSQPLTVWRKLWIERDSMAAVATSGSQKNLFEGTADSYTKDGPFTVIDLGQKIDGEMNHGVNHFLSGRFKASNIATPYVVLSSTKNYLYDDEVTVNGDLNADGASLSNYKLYDDDWKWDVTSQSIVSQVTLPNTTMTLGTTYENIYKAAYIELNYLSSEFSDTVSFQRNLSSDLAYWHINDGDWHDYYDVPSQNDFWTILLVSGFQPENDADGDPAEETVGGVTSYDSKILLYLESAREGASVEKQAAHEIGHVGAGLGHCSAETCIMDKYATQGYFCSNCIKKIRAKVTY